MAHLMEKEHPKWGPSLPQYIETFEDRLNDSFDKYVARKETTIEATNNLIPLTLLETTLAAGENMHKVGFQTGDQLFPVLMSTIRGYAKMHKGGIFGHYYGFLCIRHLIRMVCIGTMTENETFDEFLEEMEPDMDWQEVTELLSAESFDIMTGALATQDLMSVAGLLGCVSARGNAFVIDGGLSYEDVEFLVQVLWNDRKSIILLRTCGLLPGLPALLFVMCEMTIFSRTPQSKKPWLHVQDLLLRCYLGDTSDAERNTLRQLCRFLHTRILEYDLPDKYLPMDEYDARTVAEAYITLLSPPLLDLYLAPIMLLDISTILFRWVFLLMTNPNRRRVLAEELVPGVVGAALARLGLELERERDGPMQDTRRGFTRNYAADVFQHASLFEERIVTPKVRTAFSQMLFDVDIHGLAGRVLMFITRETDDQPDSWDAFMGSFQALHEALQALPPPLPSQTESIALEWRKVFLHLMYHLQSSLPSRTPNHLVGEAMETWDLTRPASVKRAPDFFKCANPRCAIPMVYARPPEARIVCARCEEATYCGLRCQRIHWTLDSESHVHECR